MSAPPPRSRRPLSDGWQLHLVDAGDGAPDGLPATPLPAVVPGTVHQDLLRAGLIPDPDVGTNEAEQHWVGRSTWAYTSTLEWQPADADRVELVCEGLDTVASVHLNGEELGGTRNMHRRHRFDVTDRLRVGDNDLRIVFHPVHEEVDRVREEVGTLPATEAAHYPYVRKMACNFGWDWGPVLVTAGIWRDIGLESWSTARFDQVRPLASLDGDTGVVDVHVTVERRSEGAGDLRVRAILGETVVTGAVDGEAGHVRLTVPDVRRWWPTGHGEQPRYEVTIELLDGVTVLDRLERRLGFRTVEVREEPDASGHRWAIVVNGRRIPIRGFNWIPDRPFPSEVPRDRYRRRIGQALEANANLLRVWGGGIYEAPDLYEACDRSGVLVWQDFLFACAAYPETAEYRAEVAAEARQAIVDRCHHPSLVLWNGNNECTWGFSDWGWQQVLGGRPWGGHYYGELLPRLVAELDPTRPYLPGSPSSGDLGSPPNDDARGPSHLWDVWNERDYLHYRDRSPAFVAEFGYCGPPTWATLRRAVPAGALTLDDPTVLHHQRAEGGARKLRRGLAEHFPEVADEDDWLWLAQLNQARALTVGVDHLRGLERCSGAVVWQLNDCWPVISWAAIDGDERRKPVWYALRDAFAPRRVTVQPDGDGLALIAVNDRVEGWPARVRVRRVGFDGTVHAEADLGLEAEGVSTARTPLPEQLAVPADPRRELLVADVDGAPRSTWFWLRDRDLVYPRAAWETEVTPSAGGLRLRVTATTLVRDLAVFPDRLLVGGRPLGPDAVASDLLVTLLPGESVELRVTGAATEHADAIVRRPVLRAVNDLDALVGPG
jgi:beta-mannosidase